jgi:hypothetical protein
MRTLKTLAALPLLLLLGCGEEPLGSGTRTVQLSCGSGCNHAESKDGTGVATVDGATGKVEILVEKLPKLSGELYEGWLAGGGETAISTGTFNTDDSGNASSTIVIGDISDRTYERVVLTVEPDPDPSPKPDPRHSIGGDL